jgi:adenylyltransferase/sulfurtransferase
MHPDEVSVFDLKRALDNPSLGIRLLDVREPEEFQIARIPGAQLVPLSQLGRRWAELNPDQPYFIYCKSGVRSLHAVQFLRRLGFRSLKSVQGGIAAWSEQVDPSVPKY